MHVINLMGGLGNQMFQYAFAKAYSYKNSCDCMLDLSWFNEIKNNKNVTQRVYELNCFNIDLPICPKEEVKLFLKSRKNIFPGIIRKIFNIPKYKSLVITEQNAGVYEKELLEKKDEAYFIGYFQSEKYFKDYRTELLKDFSLNLPLNEANQAMLNNIKLTNSVSLHVRRGDYVNLQEIHGLCALDYYKKAINYIGNKVENPHFYLFSDDIEWVKQNLEIQYPFTVVDINSSKEGYFDLELMKNCKHNIIANSSFSWWGAWLNENPDKIVIAPKHWFVSKDLRYDDIVCEDWIKF